MISDSTVIKKDKNNLSTLYMEVTKAGLSMNLQDYPVRNY